MKCTANSLCDKDVISVENGTRIGTVSDIEFDCENGCILSFVIHGKQGFLGVMGKSEDVLIPWTDVDVIGEDTILVKYKSNGQHLKAKNYTKI